MTGRNAPCPCGSGRKYKKCCLERDQARETQESSGWGEALSVDQNVSGPAEVDLFDRHRHFDQTSSPAAADLFRARAGQQFGSEADLHAFMNQHQAKANNRAVDDFQGLSPHQMHRLLHFPFDSSELIRFTAPGEQAARAPMIVLMQLLFDGIGEKGLKPTATGNLPRKLCRDSAMSYWGKTLYEKHTRYGNINSEPDFGDLHKMRLLAQLAGLIRKYRGKFVLTNKCRKAVATGGVKALYPELFKVYAREFNWGYQDGYDEIAFVQQSFAFTLHLLHRSGAEWQPPEHYSNLYIQAFPMVLDEIQPKPWASPEETLKRAYGLRTLERFLVFTGLVEVDVLDDSLLDRKWRVRTTSLFDEVVQFGSGGV